MKRLHQQTDPELMYQRIYRFRMLGMLLSGLAIATVLFERNASWSYWAMCFFTAVIWPQLAYLTAKNSTTPYIAERNNLMFDSFLAGLWTALLFFNLLPSVLLISISTADKISSGIKNLWLYALGVILVGMMLGGLITGFEFAPQTSQNIIIACIPLLTIHTLSVSFGAHLLIRKLHHKNQLLNQLSNTDALTGVNNRANWNQQTLEMLEKSASTGHQFAYYLSILIISKVLTIVMDIPWVMKYYKKSLKLSKTTP